MDRELIDEHLSKLSLSAEFHRSERMVRFLRHVVSHAVECQWEELKERRIAEQVFDRSADYDPKLDPIVRTEARRLRKKLQAYYDSEGRKDVVRIGIPKGGYIPKFESVAPASVPPPAANRSFLSWPVWHNRVLLALCGVLAGIVIAYFIRRDNPESSRPAFEVVPLANEYGRKLRPVISPDAQRVAYVWDGNGTGFRVYIKNVRGGSPVRLTSGQAPEFNPAWSPDGKFIAFLRLLGRTASVVVQPVSGSSERAIAQVEHDSTTWTDDAISEAAGCGPVWTRDGLYLLVSDGMASRGDIPIHRVSVATGERTALTRPPGVARDFYPAPSPDGKSVAFVRYSSHGVGEVFVMPAAGGDPHQITRLGNSVRGLSWTPDSRRLVVACNQSGAYRLWTLPSSGGPLELVPTTTSSAADPAVAPNSDWIAYTEIRQNWNIWRAKVSNGHIGAGERFIASSGRNHTPCYSPDGSRIAFISDRSGAWEIWVCERNGEKQSQLTHLDGPWLGGLSWSPDGRWIAFDARPKGHSSVYLIASSGGTPQRLDSNNFEERMPSWSSDGRWIYFNSSRDGKVAIWKKSVDGGPAVSVLTSGFQVRQASGQKALYFDRPNEPGIWKLREGDLAPSPLAATFQAAPHLNWALVQDGIYFINNQSRVRNICFYRFANGQLTDLGAAGYSFLMDTPGISADPGGSYLLFAQQEYTSSDINIRRKAVKPR